jgi:microcystin-dependent protein
MNQFLGEIRMFAGTFAPVGWEFCNGQLLSIAENDALFALLGTTYGGDGVTTFAVPDLRGRAPIHVGQGPGLSPRVLGEMAGTEYVSLTAAQLPQHYHPVRASTASGTLATPANNVWGASSTGEKQYTQNAPNVTMSANSTSTSGGGQPHHNMMPYQTLSFIIAVYGLFPSQS